MLPVDVFVFQPARPLDVFVLCVIWQRQDGL
jgi:hypothetical protein